MEHKKSKALLNSELGVKEHPGIPLIFAWGMHITLSYQRSQNKQASLEDIVENGINEPAKWGANLVDFYPSNKEGHFKEEEFFEQANPPIYLFREYPDSDQEFQWDINKFLEFNRVAHKKDFINSWMIHHWYKYPHIGRARVMWKCMQELGLHVGDPLRQGWQEIIDGFMVEGSFFVPEAVCEYLWPFHPGMYYKETQFNYNYTVPNAIISGVMLTDGRSLFCDSDYSIKPDWSVLGNPEIWKGKDYRTKYGRQYVTFQTDIRDIKGTENWSEYGGMSTVDTLIEQMHNYARAKGVNWEGACTTSFRHIDEILCSKKMKRYVYGISQDPVRCAVAGQITSTGKGERFERVDKQKGSYFLQNNHFRLYCIDDCGKVELQWDPKGLADHTEFLSKNILCISRSLIDSQALPEQIYKGMVCHELEEAGAIATLKQRVEWRSPDGDAMSEFRFFTTEADSPWVRVKISRLFQTNEYESMSLINFEGYNLRKSQAGKIKPGEIVHFTKKGYPDILMLLPDCAKDGIESVVWEGGILKLKSPKKKSILFEYLILIGPDRVNKVEAKWLLSSPEVSMASGEAIVENPTGLTCMRAVHIVDPSEGVYFVEEDGWWMCRPAHPSLSDMDTDYCKLLVIPDKISRIRPYGLLDGTCKPGWGCQYITVLKDVVSTRDGGSATVKIVDISPKIFAPRIEFANTLAEVTIDDKPWYYFDEKFVFLPQKRGTYQISVKYGNPQTPHMISTFAKVTDTKWTNGYFEFTCDWNEWSDGAPDTFMYQAAIKLEGHKLEEANNCEIIRRTPLFESAKTYELSGDDSVIHMVPKSYNVTPYKPLNPNGGAVVKFLPGTIRLSFGK